MLLKLVFIIAIVTVAMIGVMVPSVFAEISMPEIPIEQLRNDEYIPFDEKLIEKMNHYKGTYVRAPKM